VWGCCSSPKVPPGGEKFHELLTSRLTEGADVCRVHGDLSLSNLAAADGRIWLFDWEYTDAAGPVLTDPVGYFLSFTVGKAARDPARHVEAFERRFLKGADDRRVLDVMLALAHRHAAGLPDAAVYMKHWRPEKSI
jgi:aminoglycoside phosphotransferase family enzyme